MPDIVIQLKAFLLKRLVMELALDTGITYVKLKSKKNLRFGAMF